MSSVVADLPIAETPRRTIDPSSAIFVVISAALGVLVLLPLFWLARYSLSDGAGHVTLVNFRELVSDTSLRKPAIVSITMALGVGALSAAIAAPLLGLSPGRTCPGEHLFEP